MSNKMVKVATRVAAAMLAASAMISSQAPTMIHAAEADEYSEEAYSCCEDNGQAETYEESDNNQSDFDNGDASEEITVVPETPEETPAPAAEAAPEETPAPAAEAAPEEAPAPAAEAAPEETPAPAAETAPEETPAPAAEAAPEEAPAPAAETAPEETPAEDTNPVENDDETEAEERETPAEEADNQDDFPAPIDEEMDGVLSPADIEDTAAMENANGAASAKEDKPPKVDLGFFTMLFGKRSNRVEPNDLKNGEYYLMQEVHKRKGGRPTYYFYVAQIKDVKTEKLNVFMDRVTATYDIYSTNGKLIEKDAHSMVNTNLFNRTPNHFFKITPDIVKA